MSDIDEYEYKKKILSEDKLIEWARKNDPKRLDKVEIVLPDESWTEREINDWIKIKGLPIDYDIRRRTKKWALNQIQLNNRR